jgi:hypothetical protein
MPNQHVEKIPLVSYVCQGKCLQSAWTLPGLPGFFSNLIVKKTKKFNHLRRFWEGLKTKMARTEKIGKEIAGLFRIRGEKQINMIS